MSTHYGVQVRVYLDSVGSVIGGVDRSYALRLLEDGESYFQDLAASKTYADPIGIMGLETTEAMGGHSGSISLILGRIGSMLRTRLQNQDCLRIEANVGAGWRCLFDGFVSAFSWSKTSSVRGISWRLNLRADGFHKLLRQSWLNWRMAVTAGAWDATTKAGMEILGKMQKDMLYMAPQKMIGMLLDYGVSNLMKGITGRDGVPVQRGDYWQFGNFGDPVADPDTPFWHNAMGLGLSNAIFTYLQAEGPLWSTITSVMEPTLHELFVTYLPKGGPTGDREIPTLVFRPIPFPGPASDPCAVAVGPAPALPPGVSYPDDNEWHQLPVLQLGTPWGPAPVSIQASKSDGERKNFFAWSMASAMDGQQDQMLYKGQMGYYLDEDSVGRYGFSCDRVSTSVYSRVNPQWLNQEIPRILARVAFQRAPLPYLWTHQRHYSLLPGARCGTVLEDTTDSACGYISSVAHQIQSGDPNSFHAATTLTVERVVEGAVQGSYPDAVRAYLPNLKRNFYVPGLAEQKIELAKKGLPPPKGGWVRWSPISGAPGSGGLTPTPGAGLDAKRRCGMHHAIDYLVSQGTPLYAPLPGTVLPGQLQAGIGAGNYIKFQCDDGSIHVFAHLNAPPLVAPGQRFSQGQQLGVSGKSGDPSGLMGAHLHWQCYYISKDRAIDPVIWLTNGGSPT